MKGLSFLDKASLCSRAEFSIRLNCRSLTWKFVGMESGVCFALFKVIGESGLKLGNSSASFREFPNTTKVCFRQNLFLS